MINLSLVIPCYNEVESLPLLKSKLLEFIAQKQNLEFELVFVNDGSTDATEETIRTLFSAQAALFPHVHIIRNEKNLNLGGALRRGFQAAQGDWVGVLDADGSYDPKLMLLFLELAEMRQLDIVSASATHPRGGFAGHTPWWRVMLSRGVQVLYNIILFKNYYSYTSMFRLYRRTVIQKINYQENGFMAMAEILTIAILSNYKILDLPARSDYRQFGESKARIKKIMLAHLKFLGRLVLYRLFSVSLYA